LVFRRFFRITMAKRPVLYLRVVCHEFATADGVEVFHRVLQGDPAGVEVRIRLADVGVPEDLLHVVQGHTRLEPSRSGFMAQVMELQIDGFERGAGRG
jgi:hypothetical protein